MGVRQTALPLPPPEDVCPSGECRVKRIQLGQAERLPSAHGRAGCRPRDPPVELVGYRTTWEDIFGLYQEVYQLRRTPGPVPGSPEVAEQTHQEILDSLRECLHHRWGSPQTEEPMQPTRTPAVVEYHTQTHTISEHFGCY